ncbi:glycosyltransferase family 2 protein [Ottowia thiooxydans]|uniref:glycosyltransferase family 2 protein n=1 Tax=Ottowia thiooxydans TaxID=219182 RepID=UPI00146B2453|nr:glycosyltransferase family A protein [Ottowia thiooxydans]
MNSIAATVVIPTFDHGPLIGLAVDSALRQTVPVEVFIIGDGVPEDQKPFLYKLAAREPRVRFFDHPKSPGRGEQYRHAALAHAQGEIVCYLCDRDLWLPDHVAQLLHLLQGADFAHSLPLHVLEKQVVFFSVDLIQPPFRDELLRVGNRIPLSCAGHTLSFYRRLPQGWTATPPGQPTDWHMFRKFLGHPKCRCASGTLPTAITFPSPPRKDWAPEIRLKELQAWQARITNPAERQVLVIHLLQMAIKTRDYELATFLAAHTPNSAQR